MKETTGELNLTIVVVLAVAVLVAFFYYIIWPGLDDNFNANSKCSVAVCKNPCESGSSGVKAKNACGDMSKQLAECHYTDEKGREYGPFYCPWKG